MKELLFTLLFLGFTAAVSAQEIRPINQPDELQILESYFRLAAENNPELNSLRLEVEAQREQIPQVRALPDPEITAGYYINPENEANISGRFSVTAMQMLPWFGTLSARGELEENISEVMAYSLTARQLEIFSEIQDMWFQYFRLNHHIHINSDIIQIIEDLENLVEVRYESGRTGQADILRLQMERQRLLNIIEQLEDEKNPIRIRLNSLLNRNLSDNISVPMQLPERILAMSKDELFNIAQSRHPDFDRLNAQRNQFKNQLDLARLEGLPAVGIGLQYMGTDFGMMSMMDLDPVFIGMASINIPLYRGKYRAQRREARLQLQSIDEREIEVQNRFQSEIEKSMKKLRDGQRNYQLITEELLPRTEQVLDILSDEYSSGQIQFDEMLQVLRELLALENEKVEALTTQNKAMAEIEQLIGNELLSNE